MLGMLGITEDIVIAVTFIIILIGYSYELEVNHIDWDDKLNGCEERHAHLLPFDGDSKRS